MSHGSDQCLNQPRKINAWLTGALEGGEATGLAEQEKQVFLSVREGLVGISLRPSPVLSVAQQQSSEKVRPLTLIHWEASSCLPSTPRTSTHPFVHTSPGSGATGLFYSLFSLLANISLPTNARSEARCSEKLLAWETSRQSTVAF